MWCIYAFVCTFFFFWRSFFTQSKLALNSAPPCQSLQELRLQLYAIVPAYPLFPCLKGIASVMGTASFPDSVPLPGPDAKEWRSLEVNCGSLLILLHSSNGLRSAAPSSSWRNRYSVCTCPSPHTANLPSVLVTIYSDSHFLEFFMKFGRGEGNFELAFP